MDNKNILQGLFFALTEIQKLLCERSTVRTVLGCFFLKTISDSVLCLFTELWEVNHDLVLCCSIFARSALQNEGAARVLLLGVMNGEENKGV